MSCEAEQIGFGFTSHLQLWNGEAGVLGGGREQRGSWWAVRRAKLRGAEDCAVCRGDQNVVAPLSRSQVIPATSLTRAWGAA